MQVQREKIQSGRKKDKKFEGEDGVRVMHYQKEARWARLSRGGISAEGVQGESHSAGRCGIFKKKAGKEDPEMRAAKNSEFRKGE